MPRLDRGILFAATKEDCPVKPGNDVLEENSPRPRRRRCLGNGNRRHVDDTARGDGASHPDAIHIDGQHILWL
jgi:hypothetical protein